jgi:hypothetical protein
VFFFKDTRGKEKEKKKVFNQASTTFDCVQLESFVQRFTLIMRVTQVKTISF